MTLQELISQITVWEDWKTRYQQYVPKFITEASSKDNFQDWDQDVFKEFFEKSNDQCVSSLRQGYFTYEERDEIKKNWHELGPLLKQIADSQDIPLFDVYQQVKALIRACTDQNRMAATNRMIASLQPNLLCSVVNEAKLKHLISLLNQKIAGCNLAIEGDWFKNSAAVLNYFKQETGIENPFDLITYPWQSYEWFLYDQETVADNDMSEPNNSFSKTKELLEYKKQIILQGPPGTGKTKLAKEIAKSLIGSIEYKDKKVTAFTVDDIKNTFEIGQTINSATNYTEYTITEIGTANITLKLKNTGTEYKAPYQEILQALETKMWEGKQKNGTHPYSAAIAKFIYNSQINHRISHHRKNQFQLIQFHPSYSYEDFVRGIDAKPNLDGDGVEYKADNRILAKFAKLALDNYKLSQIDKEESKKVVESKSNFEKFIEYVFEEIAKNSEHKFPLTDSVYLFEGDENRFKYKGDNWVAHGKGLNMKFSELEKIIQANVKERADVKNISGIEALTAQHATYFFNTAERYRAFVAKNTAKLNGIQLEEKTKLKNYVLIIDEINRANLSSVLGELIYALEYRGEAVDSMYEVNGTNKITLPPNLYIIGTMNTADRSVGYIDYAIRRRFAFVDVLPEDLAHKEGIVFYSDLFEKVSSLFISNYPDYKAGLTTRLEAANTLSPEFRPEDVWLGHSYFIENAGATKALRLEYEILPILKEYLKDGVLFGDSAKVIINELEAMLN